MIEFSFEGNHLDPNGNPLGYTRTTTRQKWDPKYVNYQQYKQWVVKQYWNRMKGVLEPSMEPHPFNGNVRGKVYLNIAFSSERHADPDNVGKAILDALFANDKEIDLDTTHTCKNKQSKVIVKIDMYERSSCCGAPVRVEPQEELEDIEGKTFYYICTNCGNPCDMT